MGFGDLMILANSVPNDVSFAPSVGLWLGAIGVLCAAACGALTAGPYRRTRAPRVRAIRFTEAPSLR